MTMLTAMEIYTNPKDIHVTIRQTEGKYGFSVTRGPGHHFKPMLSCHGSFSTRGETTAYIKTVFDVAIEHTSMLFAPGDDLLTPEDISALLVKLESADDAGTYS